MKFKRQNLSANELKRETEVDKVLSISTVESRQFAISSRESLKSSAGYGSKCYQDVKSKRVSILPRLQPSLMLQHLAAVGPVQYSKCTSKRQLRSRLLYPSSLKAALPETDAAPYSVGG